MPKHRTLSLTEEQERELCQVRDHAKEAYLRERAAALLKIAHGECAAHVARHGLLRPREPDTVYRWLARYLREGVAGLRVKAGRGRKPSFSPLGARSAPRTRAALAPGAPKPVAVRH